MFNNRKIQLAGLLMGASILLLVLFQAYWLRNTYRDEFGTLRRELGLILRETTIRRQMQQMMNGNGNRLMIRMGRPLDSSDLRMEREEGDTGSSSGRMRWEMSLRPSGSDSGLGRRGARIIALEQDRRSSQRETMDRLAVVAPFFGDSLPLASLDTQYRRSLQDNEIELRYQLRVMTRAQIDSMQAQEMSRSGMFFRRGMPAGIKMEMLEASFESPFWYILPRMRWPLLFSLLMLGITIAAFLFLYRSLKAQHRLALLKSDFISNVTHELKTPIATVGVAIEALKNFNAMNDPQRTREYLDISGNELQRLGLLVDKVLRLSMFEQEKMEMRREPLQLEELLQEVLQSMKLQFEKAGASVDLQVHMPASPVSGDRLHLLSVLYNLLDNALKYSDGKPEIKITMEQDSPWLRLMVQDNGIGIPAEYRNRVFDKFFRVPHGDTHTIKGYGLGLSYVAEVLKKHGGHIEVKPAPGKGSLFIVTLPLAGTPA